MVFTYCIVQRFGSSPCSYLPPPPPPPNAISLCAQACSLTPSCSMQQVKSLRFTVEQRLELSLPYNGQPRRVKQKAVIASSIRELSSTSPSEFKKRYFITMPTLCTTINSPIISTRYTVRIQMTSTQVPVLTLEVPVTMYSKGSFINGCAPSSGTASWFNAMPSGTFPNYLL